MKSLTSNSSNHSGWPEREILEAIRGIRFGVLEVIVHYSRVTEIRQTHRMRMTIQDAEKISSDLKQGD